MFDHETVRFSKDERPAPSHFSSWRASIVCRQPRGLFVGSVALCLLLITTPLRVRAQDDILSIVHPPQAAHPIRHIDPAHPAPPPGAPPDPRARPGALARPLPAQWPPEAEDEDTENLVALWKHRRSPSQFQELARQALAMPGEHGKRPTLLGPDLGMQPLTPVTNAWSQIGVGDNGNDAIHNDAGRMRGAAYAWDNTQSATILWVGSTGGGLWKTLLLGFFGVFVPVSDNLPGSPSVGAFLVHPNDSSRILIGSGDSYRYSGSGLYKTTDEGATWNLIPGNWPSAFQKILDDSNDTTGNTVLAEGDTGIWRSTHFGSTWTQSYNGSASDLVQDPNYPYIWYAGAPGVGVVRSLDYGQSFSPVGSGISTPIGRVSVALSASASWHVYALTEGTFGNLGGIWRSDDYGSGTWQSLDNADNISWGQAYHTCAIGVDPADADRLFVGMGGMQVTTNATSNTPTWNTTYDGGHADFTSFNFEHGTNNVLITNDGGIYVYDDSANTVNGELNLLGFDCQQTFGPAGCLAGSRTVPDLLLAGLQDNGMVRIDRNDNPAILKIGGGDGGVSSISPDNPNLFVFSSGAAFNRYYSTDQGADWVGINYGLGNGWGPTVMIDQTPSGGQFNPYLYTTSGAYVWYKPVDPTNDWAKANSTPLPSSFSPRSMDASVDRSAYVFYVVGWGTGELYVMDSYSDGRLGQMGWEVRTPPLPADASDSDSQIAADRSTLQPYTITYTTGASTPSRAFLSTNRGQSWIDVTGDLVTKLPNASYWQLVANPADQTQLFLATEVGVYRSDNGGVNWYSYNAGLPAMPAIYGMELNYDNASPPLLHIGTYGRGFWDRQVAGDSAIRSIVIAPSTVGSQQAATGTITLNKTAPANIVVQLQSSAPSIASAPSTVTIPAGATSAQFAIATGSVTSPTQVTFSATYNEVTDSATLTVEPWISAVTFHPAAVTGGASSTGTVNLALPSPSSGLTLQLASNDTNVAAPTVSTLTVPAGQTSAKFTVKTKAVASIAIVNITATNLGASTNGTLTVEPLALSTLTLSPATVVGGKTATGKITLTGRAPAGGAAVTLSSANFAASVPATVTILANATSASFTITTTAVTSKQSGNITASFSGGTLNRMLTVRPIQVSSVVLAPNPVVGGNTVAGTVTLESPAEPGAITVSLSSTGAAVAAPTASSITIAAGQTTGTFTITTKPVTKVTKVTIDAKANSVTVGKVLTVNP